MKKAKDPFHYHHVSKKQGHWFRETFRRLEHHLHLLKEESHKRHSPFQCLCEGALNNLSAYVYMKDQVERTHDTDARENVKETLGETSVEFPTWEILALLSGVAHDVEKHRFPLVLLEILGAVQKTVELWIQWNQSSVSLFSPEDFKSVSEETHHMGLIEENEYLTYEQFSTFFQLICPITRLGSVPRHEDLKVATSSVMTKEIQGRVLGYESFVNRFNLSCLSFLHNTVYAPCQTPHDLEQVQQKVIQVLVSFFQSPLSLFYLQDEIFFHQVDPFLTLVLRTTFPDLYDSTQNTFKVPYLYRLFMTLLFFQCFSESVQIIARAALFQVLRLLMEEYFQPSPPIVHYGSSRHCLELCFVLILRHLTLALDSSLAYNHHGPQTFTPTFSDPIQNDMGQAMDLAAKDDPSHSSHVCLELLLFLLNKTKHISYPPNLVVAFLKCFLESFLFRSFSMVSCLKESVVSLHQALLIFEGYLNLIYSMSLDADGPLASLWIAQQNMDSCPQDVLVTFSLNTSSWKTSLGVLLALLCERFGSTCDPKRMSLYLDFFSTLLCAPRFFLYVDSSLISLLQSHILRYLNQVCMEHQDHSVRNSLDCHGIDQRFNKPTWWNKPLCNLSFTTQDIQKTFHTPGFNSLTHTPTPHEDSKKHNTPSPPYPLFPTWRLTHSRRYLASNLSMEKNPFFSESSLCSQDTLKSSSTLMWPSSSHSTLHQSFHSSNDLVSTPRHHPKGSLRVDEPLGRCISFQQGLGCFASSLMALLSLLYQELDESVGVYPVSGSGLEYGFSPHMKWLPGSSCLLYTFLFRPFTQMQQRLHHQVNELWASFLSVFALTLANQKLVCFSTLCFVLEMLEGLIALLGVLNISKGLTTVLKFFIRILSSSIDHEEPPEVGEEESQPRGSALEGNPCPQPTQRPLNPFLSRAFHVLCHLTYHYGNTWSVGHWMLILEGMNICYQRFPKQDWAGSLNWKHQITGEDTHLLKEEQEKLLPHFCGVRLGHPETPLEPFFYSLDPSRVELSTQSMHHYFQQSFTLLCTPHPLHQLILALVEHIKCLLAFLKSLPGALPVVPQADSPIVSQADSPIVPQADSSIVPQADSSIVPQADLSIVPQADSSIVPQADSSIVLQADSSIVPQADSSIVPQADSSIVPQADSSIVPQADLSIVPQADSPVELQGEYSKVPSECTPLVNLLINLVIDSSVSQRGSSPFPCHVFTVDWEVLSACVDLETLGDGPLKNASCGLSSLNYFLCLLYTSLLLNAKRLQTLADLSYLCRQLSVVSLELQQTCSALCLECIEFVNYFCLEIIQNPSGQCGSLPWSVVQESGSHFAPSFLFSISPIHCVSLLLGIYFDIFHHMKFYPMQYTILKQLFTFLYLKGGRLETCLSWTVVALIVGQAGLECFHDHHSLWVSCLEKFHEHPFHLSPQHPGAGLCPVGSSTKFPLWGRAQKNIFFQLVELVVLEFRHRINEPTCLLVMALSLACLASSPESSHNVSFTAVRLLWTLGESLLFLPAHDLYATPQPYAVFSSMHYSSPHALLCLAEHPYYEAQLTVGHQRIGVPLYAQYRYLPETVRWKVVVLIFHLLRYPALDSRVEVRNCSLKSLVSVYESTSQLVESPQDHLKTSLGTTLLAVSQAMIWQYKMLSLKPSPAVEGRVVHHHALQHHSRDSELKLWDETLMILFNAILMLIHSDVTSTQQRVGSHAPFHAALVAPLSEVAVELPRALLLNFTWLHSASLSVVSSCLSFVAAVMIRTFSLSPEHLHYYASFWTVFEAFSSLVWHPEVFSVHLCDLFMTVIQKLSGHMLHACGTPQDFSPVLRCCRGCLLLLLYVITCEGRGEKKEGRAVTHSVHAGEEVCGCGSREPCSRFPLLKQLVESQSGSCSETSAAVFPPNVFQELSASTLGHLYESLEDVGDAMRGAKGTPVLSEALLEVFQVDGQEREYVAMATLDGAWPVKSPVLCRDAIASASFFPKPPPGPCGPSLHLSGLFSVEAPQTLTPLEPVNASSPQHSTFSHFFTLSLLTRLTIQSTPPDCCVVNAQSAAPQTITRFDDDYATCPDWLESTLQQMMEGRYPLSSALDAMKLQRRFVCAPTPVMVDVCFQVLESIVPWPTFLVEHPFVWLALVHQALKVSVFPQNNLLESMFGLSVLWLLPWCLRLGFLAIHCHQALSFSVYAALGLALYQFFAKVCVLMTQTHRCLTPAHFLFFSQVFAQMLLDAQFFCKTHWLHSPPLLQPHIHVLFEFISLCLLLLADYSSHHLTLHPIPLPRDQFFYDAYQDLMPLCSRALLGLDQPSLLHWTKDHFPLSLFIATIVFLDTQLVLAQEIKSHVTEQLIFMTWFDMYFMATHTPPDDATHRNLGPKLHFLMQHVVRRLKAFFAQFCLDDERAGKCPLPRYRLDNVLLILQRLKACKTPPQHPPPTIASSVPATSLDGDHPPDLPPGPSPLPRQDSNLLVALYPDIVQLINTKNACIRQKLVSLLSGLPSF